MIEMLGDRILVQPDPANDKFLEGGAIVKADIAKEKPVQGTVLAVGDSDQTEAFGLVKGQKVLYGKFAGAEIELEGQECLIMRAEEVMAVVKDKKHQPGLKKYRKDPTKAPAPADYFDPIGEPEAIECPHCSRKVTGDHSCPKKDFELVLYADLVTPAEATSE